MNSIVIFAWKIMLEEKIQIQSIEIKGYKAIKRSKIDLEPGLNIVIGRNSSGKSILFDAIREFAISVSKFNRAPRFNQIKFSYLTHNKKSIDLELSRTMSELSNPHREDDIEDNSLNVYLKYQEARVDIDFKNQRGSIRRIIYREKKILLPQIHYIGFNLPKSLEYIETPGKLTFTFDRETNSLYNMEPFNSEIMWNYLFKLDSFVEELQKIPTKKQIEKVLKFDSGVKEALKEYSPINDIRFSHNFNIYSDDKVCVIDNIFLEFKIDGTWLPWSFLSDGTKRLFYLIHEVVTNSDSIMLIEEPELGVHPHQFHKILQLLSEESNKRQILISTHSPQSLNILSRDELDNIILSSYDPSKGSTYKHLSLTQKKKASRYMSEVGFLSDYWLHSDLEK